MSSTSPLTDPAADPFVALTRHNLSDLTHNLTSMADGKEVVVLTFGRDRVSSNYVSPGTFTATPRSDGIGLDIAGRDNQGRGDGEFWTACWLDDEGYLVRPGHSVDLRAAGVTFRFLFVEADDMRPDSEVLIDEDISELADRIATMADGQDVVMIHTRDGMQDIAHPFAAASFNASVNNQGVALSGTYVEPASGSFGIVFGAGLRYIVRADHSVDFIAPDGVYSLRFLKPAA